MTPTILIFIHIPAVFPSSLNQGCRDRNNFLDRTNLWPKTETRRVVKNNVRVINPYSFIINPSRTNIYFYIPTFKITPKCAIKLCNPHSESSVYPQCVLSNPVLDEMSRICPSCFHENVIIFILLANLILPKRVRSVSWFCKRIQFWWTVFTTKSPKISVIKIRCPRMLVSNGVTTSSVIFNKSIKWFVRNGWSTPSPFKWCYDDVF